MLRAAHPSEAAELTALTMRSKAHHGYDQDFLDAARDELTVRPEDCTDLLVVAHHPGGRLLGYYRIAGGPPCGELDSLFVDPSVIGTGLGGRLLAAARSHAGRLGFSVLRLDADPSAEGFYLHAGARRIGEVASGSVRGRTLPRLELTVSRSPRP